MNMNMYEHGRLPVFNGIRQQITVYEKRSLAYRLNCWVDDEGQNWSLVDVVIPVSCVHSCNL